MLWRIELLGELRAHSSDHTITRFQTYKTGALLAYLAYFRGKSHSREALINIFWPDVEPTAARNRLSQALVWLRPRLEPTEEDRNTVLLTDRHSIGLNIDAVETDTAQVELILRSASNANPQDQIRLLRSVVDLYSGELLTGFYEDWVFPERQNFAQIYLGVLHRLIGLYEEVQELDRALDYARRALTVDPLVEEVHRDLIRVLAQTGQPAAALRQYHELEKILSEKLGEAPSSETRVIVEAIRKETALASATPASNRRTPPSKIPTPLTRFFGRDEEIVGVQRIIVSGQARLVTLIGPGGCGKTRLAIEIATRIRDKHSRPVWFVPLADVQEARGIPYAIADAIRTPVPSLSSMQEQVIDWLTGNSGLLVLDNMEHLIEGAAMLVHEILERVPGLTILATSRQSLSIDGEREVAVLPLPLPKSRLNDEPLVPEDLESLMHCESVQLFVDRAQSVHAAFVLDAHNAQAIARLCHRLEGIPLATELCATWAQTLTPAQMLEELSRPFDLLVSRRRDVSPRHRSLRAAVEYSYNRLNPMQQQFFNRLSVFRSGWSLEGAEAVCVGSDERSVGHLRIRTLDLLTELRERSLVTVEESGNAMRFRMLETLREFSAKQQSATESDQTSLRRRHAEYYLRLAESAEPHLARAGQLDYINHLGVEHDNLRAALSWAIVTGEAETGLRLAGALAIFWDARGFLSEGQNWLTQVLSLPNPYGHSQQARLIRAKALTALGNLARNQGNVPEVNAAIQEAIQIWRECRSDKGTSEALQILATIAYSHDDAKIARNYLHEGLLLARRLQDRMLMALALHNLGNIALANRQWTKAHSHYIESLSLYRAEGNRSRSARILNNLGLVARYQGDYKTALTIFHEALETSRELSDRSGMAMTSLNLVLD